MELGEMVQKPGEWNDSLQRQRCPRTTATHLDLCWASRVRREAAGSQQMWRSRAICLSALWLPGELLQSLCCGQQPLLGKKPQRLRQSVCLDRRWFHRCKKGLFEGSVRAWKRCQTSLTTLAHLPFSYQHLEGLHPAASSAWLPSALLVHSQPSALLAANEVIQRLCQPPGVFVKRGGSSKLFSSPF